MAANSKKQEPCSSGSSLQCPQLENLEKWTVKAPQKYLRVRGSGIRKAELIAMYVIKFLNTINNDNNEHDQSAESHGEWLVLW